MSQEREFYVVIERDEDGYYVADVPELPGCHTQAKSLDALLPRVREAIELYLEAFPQYQKLGEFVGIQKVTVRLSQVLSMPLRRKLFTESTS